MPTLHRHQKPFPTAELFLNNRLFPRQIISHPLWELCPPSYMVSTQIIYGKKTLRSSWFRILTRAIRRYHAMQYFSINANSHTRQECTNLLVVLSPCWRFCIEFCDQRIAAILVTYILPVVIESLTFAWWCARENRAISSRLFVSDISWYAYPAKDMRLIRYSVQVSAKLPHGAVCRAAHGVLYSCRHQRATVLALKGWYIYKGLSILRRIFVYSRHYAYTFWQQRFWYHFFCDPIWVSKLSICLFIMHYIW